MSLVSRQALVAFRDSVAMGPRFRGDDRCVFGDGAIFLIIRKITRKCSYFVLDDQRRTNIIRLVPCR